MQAGFHGEIVRAETRDNGRTALLTKSDCPGLFRSSFVSPITQQDHHELSASVCVHVLSMSLLSEVKRETKPAMYELTLPPRTGRFGEGSAPGLPGTQPLRQQLRGPRRPVHVVGPVAGGLPEPARALLPRGLLRVALLLLRPQRLCRVRPSLTLCGALMTACRCFPHTPTSRSPAHYAEPCGHALQCFVLGMSTIRLRPHKFSQFQSS